MDPKYVTAFWQHQNGELSRVENESDLNRYARWVVQGSLYAAWDRSIGALVFYR